MFKRCSPWWDLSRIMRKPQKHSCFVNSWAEISALQISGRAKLSSEMNLIDSEIVFHYVWSYRRECRDIEMWFSLWNRRDFLRWFNPIQNRSESSQNPMIRQKSDRNPGDDPTNGSVVLDPIGSYSRIRYFYRSIVF